MVSRCCPSITSLVSMAPGGTAFFSCTLAPRKCERDRLSGQEPLGDAPGIVPQRLPLLLALPHVRTLEQRHDVVDVLVEQIAQRQRADQHSPDSILHITPFVGNSATSSRLIARPRPARQLLSVISRSHSGAMGIRNDLRGPTSAVRFAPPSHHWA